LNCPKCGVTVPTGATFCRECGHSLVEPREEQREESAQGTWGEQAHSSVAYAGFWLRFVAYIIDSLIGGVVVIALIAIVAAVIGFGSLREQFEQMGREADQPNPAFPVFLVLLICVMAVCVLVISWLYEAMMESSEYQGTLGKMAIGLIVTDMQGQRVSFGRASGRFFAKLITGLVPLYIGFIMAGFTEKKQALHDMIASCLVLRKV